jgi:hypothetical protein
MRVLILFSGASMWKVSQGCSEVHFVEEENGAQKSVCPYQCRVSGDAEGRGQAMAPSPGSFLIIITVLPSCWHSETVGVRKQEDWLKVRSCQPGTEKTCHSLLPHSSAGDKCGFAVACRGQRVSRRNAFIFIFL